MGNPVLYVSKSLTYSILCRLNSLTLSLLTCVVVLHALFLHMQITYSYSLSTKNKLKLLLTHLTQLRSLLHLQLIKYSLKCISLTLSLTHTTPLHSLLAYLHCLVITDTTHLHQTDLIYLYKSLILSLLCIYTIKLHSLYLAYAQCRILSGTMAAPLTEIFRK